MTSTSLSYQARLNSIDALRGLAALTVVFYHARPMFWVGLGEIWKQYGLSIDINSWLGYATAPLYFGGLAVNLFFIISGYCIHRRGAQQLISDSKASLNLKQYAIRRIWRIYPLLYWSIKPQGNKFWGCKLGSLFTKVGFFSYSLYAIHRPILLFIKTSVVPLGERFITLIPALIASSLAVLVAWLFFTLVEKRTLKPIG
ncbi:acyltransferase family protein [Nostoc sp.]|uniref:acyltransferase family protein n=1 Tax=Nostoc sp. TaxID=1180 RepID=UPI002FF8F41D